jgi:CubicO group peptidase (beta-lactamase class C family)
MVFLSKASVAVAVFLVVSASISAQPKPATGTSPKIPGSSTSPQNLKKIDRAALQALVDKTAKELLIPGAVVLLRTPQGEFAVTNDTTLLGAKSPPSVDTYFRAASNTKTMTSAAILHLAQEGKLSLDDPVSKYVAGVPNGDHITLAELLEMRSGLYNYTEGPEISASMDHDPAKVWSPAELLAIAFAHPPNFPPGTAFEYNNTNYLLLSLVAEKVDRKPLAQSMRDRLFGPLHLQHTFFPAPAANTLPEPYSHGYLYGSASVDMLGSPSYSPEVQAAARAGTLLPNDFTGLNHSFSEGAGAVISTASDLATWIEALVAGRVLNAAYQRRWLDSLQLEVPSKPKGQPYGYGIVEISWGPNTIYFHGGETPGYNSFMGYDPNNQVTLVIWSNLTVLLDEEPTANTLMLKVLDQIYVISPLAPQPSPARD